VLAREEERRRIRRDLHDDLAPTLAGLALTARTLSDFLPGDPAKAAPLAHGLHVAIRDAVGGIRRLVYDLRPPALDDLGLLAAIRERATQFSAQQPGEARLWVTVEAPPVLPPLPAAVEVAAFRIVQEALMNVARHAHARTCHVRLALGDTLTIEITDDGAGFGDAPMPGVGLRSMQERAAELGGTWEMTSVTGGGSCICVNLPVNREGIR
jgi:signal transduction histidine kinase